MRVVGHLGPASAIGDAAQMLGHHAATAAHDWSDIVRRCAVARSRPVELRALSVASTRADSAECRAYRHSMSKLTHACAPERTRSDDRARERPATVLVRPTQELTLCKPRRRDLLAVHHHVVPGARLARRSASRTVRA
jgi:hypothetical protein